MLQNFQGPFQFLNARSSGLYDATNGSTNQDLKVWGLLTRLVTENLQDHICNREFFKHAYFLSQGFVHFGSPLTSQLRCDVRSLLLKEEHEGIWWLLDVGHVVFKLLPVIYFSTGQKWIKGSGPTMKLKKLINNENACVHLHGLARLSYR